MELAFAGVHQLCASLLNRLDHLPVPQRDAARIAFGLEVGGAPDRFLVGLAVLSLLSEVADQHALVCVVDDAQWLDRVSAQVLGLWRGGCGRSGSRWCSRVHEPSDVARAFGTAGNRGPRPGDRDSQCAAGIGAARAVGRAGAGSDRRRDARQPAGAAGAAAGLHPCPVGGRVRSSERDASGRADRAELSPRVLALPTETQRLLVTAAVEPVGDVTLLWRAAERLGIGTEAATPAEQAGLVEFGARVIFRHPLVRSAACRAASVHDLQEGHAALAQAIDPESDPDRRAWHRAHGARGPDEAVAAELERSAARAMARGGVAAAAAFLERATALTPDPAGGAGRALGAAQAKLEAAAPEAAAALLAAAAIGPLDELQRARLERLSAQVRFAEKRGNDAPPLLLRAARRLAPLDADLAP